MRPDFCAYILSHGRPDRVQTYASLRRSGYTGPIRIVIDDEDPTGDQYRARYGAEVVTFSKAAAALLFDEMDNHDERRSVVYARNALWGIAKADGYRYFIELDDDYKEFEYRFNSRGDHMWCPIRTMDECLAALLDFRNTSGSTCVALAQGGDYIGGIGNNGNKQTLRRKVMNSFICDVEQPFYFCGKLNDDVNTYVSLGARGVLLFTVIQAKLVQEQTQANAGGLTDIYKAFGTYVKSFYTVMIQPSSVKVGAMGDPRSDNYRLHHKIHWPNTVPCILSPDHRKPRQGADPTPALHTTPGPGDG
jgi:hypothetical protein